MTNKIIWQTVLDLHCLQRQDISGLNRTRLNMSYAKLSSLVMSFVQKCKLLAISLPWILLLLALFNKYSDPWQNICYHFALQYAAVPSSNRNKRFQLYYKNPTFYSLNPKSLFTVIVAIAFMVDMFRFQ